MQVLRPTVEWELAGTLLQIANDGRQVEVLGAGTKATIGRIPEADVAIELRYMRGFKRFEPADHGISVMSGTPIGDVDRDLALANLMLPFEPVDLGPMLGHQPWLGTMGGVFASNVCGSRRVVAGDAAAAMTGATIITSRGEIVRLGGPGVSVRRQPDLLSALVGSWGSLAIMTEVSFRLDRRPEQTATLLAFDLPEILAVEAMSDALKSHCGVTGAAHIEAELAARLRCRDVQAAGVPVTAIRIESSARLLPQRIERLRKALAPYGECFALSDQDSQDLWYEFQSLLPFHTTNDPIWRIVVPPSRCADVLRGLRRYFECRALIDWGGALIWLEIPASSDAGAADIRRVLAHAGGHATLIRADHEVRHTVDCFQPLSGQLEHVLSDLKSVFDPRAILNRGRLYAGL